MDPDDGTTDRHLGHDYDGKLILTEELRLAQMAWRCLLPQGVENLLVPVCLSAMYEHAADHLLMRGEACASC